MSEQKNLFLAVAISLAILMGFNYFYDRPKVEALQKQQDVVSNQVIDTKASKTNAPVTPIFLTMDESLKDMSKRIVIDTPHVKGSINLKGAYVDDLSLMQYRETTDANSPEIRLLAPENTKKAYFVMHTFEDLPDLSAQVWSYKGNMPPVLRPGQNVVLHANVAPNVRIERTFSIDDSYLITVIDRVINGSATPISFRPKAQVVRFDPNKENDMYILHEGAIGVWNKRLKEVAYKDLDKEATSKDRTKGGWNGFTDKYWLVALIPDQQKDVDVKFESLAGNIYTSTYLQDKVTLAPGTHVDINHYVFAGAKVLNLLDAYEQKLGFERFDLAVDFGWFYFITKPLFYVLEFFTRILGNVGLAILMITILSKIMLYPFSRKSFVSMARLRDLGPKIEQLKLRCGDDKMRFNQEMMELYRSEKVNPVSGCLPQLVQAPIFFCLYKVFYVTIEMRHAPFFGWIHDLSVPDPTSFVNLFGLLPFSAPSFLQIGLWPLIMGITMLIQQRMGPQPSDPVQAKMMMVMPIMFTFLFAGFPAGVVLFWSLGNIFAIAQQMYFNKFYVPTVASASTKTKK